MRNHGFMVVVLMVCTALTTNGMPADDGETEAVKAAEQWLALVDTGEYSDSWDEASELFRGAVTKEVWRQSLSGVRRPLGDMTNRSLQSAQYTTSLPGAPDGEYVVIQFATSFENKEAAIETVTPMRDEDGQWRVSGYFIK